MPKINLKFLKKIKKNISENKKRYLIISGILILAIILVSGIAYSLVRAHQQKNLKKETVNQTKNIYVDFLMEVYDTIQQNYWNKITDEQLTNLYKLAAQKLLGQEQNLPSADKNGLTQMIEGITKNMDETKKKEFSAQIANLVLVNLQPFGRSALYTQQLEQQLTEKVKNINPENDLYKTLGVGTDASQEELDKVYQEKLKELEPQQNTSAEAKDQLEKIKYAYNVLSDAQSKQTYDTTKSEPTVLGKLMSPEILYLAITKISPTTLDDLKREADKFDKGENLNTLILDLRGNIGGSLDMLQYLLGPFIGPNRYAFEIFQQGNYDPFKTKFGWLPSMVRYKKVAVLIDGKTQSSAEVMATALKEYNVGVLVGTKTKGWGTIEKVYELKNQITDSEKYSVFLVNHLTVRDDMLPIEENGVEPVVNTGDANWKKQLSEYFDNNNIIKAVESALKSEPGKI